MAENNLFKVLAERVRDARLSKRWSMVKVAELAMISTTTINEMENGKLAGSEAGRSIKRRNGLGKSIARILYVLGETDIAGWLEKAGLPHEETFIENALECLKQRKDLVLEQPLTSEDLDFLGRIQKEFAQPMTIGFAVELLRLRKGSGT